MSEMCSKHNNLCAKCTARAMEGNITLQVVAGTSAQDPGDSSLVFESVCLTYPGRRVPALDHVSFTVPAGSHFGICGRTGAGKSSILTALFQLSPLQHGSIQIGTVNLAAVSAGCASGF